MIKIPCVFEDIHLNEVIKNIEGSTKHEVRNNALDYAEYYHLHLIRLSKLPAEVCG